MSLALSPRTQQGRETGVCAFRLPGSQDAVCAVVVLCREVAPPGHAGVLQLAVLSCDRVPCPPEDDVKLVAEAERGRSGGARL